MKSITLDLAARQRLARQIAESNGIPVVACGSAVGTSGARR